MGLPAAAKAVYQLEPDGPYLATQILDMDYPSAKKKDFKDEFLQSAWSTLSTKMRFLLTDTIVRCFSGSSFTGEDLMCGKKPVSVYLHFPEQDLLAMAPFIRLFWVNLIRELIATYDARRGKGCRPVLFVLDEAGRLAVPHLDEYSSTVCERGISLMIIVQALSQLDALYGRARTETILNNMDTQLYYRPNDQETAEYLEHCLGRKSEYAHSQTVREGAETSEGRMEQGIPLMTAQEIKQMADEEVIAFHSNLPPFQARRMSWLDYPLLKARKGKTPPPVSALPDVAMELPDLATQTTRNSTSGFVNPDVVAAA